MMIRWYGLALEPAFDLGRVGQGVDHEPVVAEQRADERAHRGVVVEDQDANFPGRLEVGQAGARGDARGVAVDLGRRGGGTNGHDTEPPVERPGSTAGTRAAANGSTTRMVVPWPGRLSTCTPPRCA